MTKTNLHLKSDNINKNITSIYDTMPTDVLENKLIDIESEISALETSRNNIENILFYRKNPECKRY